MRLRVSGRVSSHFCLPHAPKRGSAGAGLSEVKATQRSTPRGPNFAEKGGALRIIRIFWLFLGVEVIKVSVELIESVDGGQEFVAVAEVVLPT
jgi:hypothetical protein